MKPRPLLGCLLVLTLAGCGTFGNKTAIDEPDRVTVDTKGDETEAENTENDEGKEKSVADTTPDSALAQMEIKDILIEVRKLLNTGDADRARSNLEHAKGREPHNKDIDCLLKSITDDPVVSLGKDSEIYRVQNGDTLGSLAQRFLGNACRFWLLARYAEVKIPKDLAAGIALRIPRQKSAPVSVVKEPKPPNIKSSSPVVDVVLDPPKLTRAALKQRIETLRREAENALRKDRLTEALYAWNALLELDPTDTDALVKRAHTLRLREKWEAISHDRSNSKR